MLDINLCTIKLHELCELDQKKVYLQNSIDFFVYEYNQLFCSSDIVLQECSQDSNTVSITPL